MMGAAKNPERKTAPLPPVEGIVSDLKEVYFSQPENSIEPEELRKWVETAAQIGKWEKKEVVTLGGERHWAWTLSSQGRIPWQLIFLLSSPKVSWQTEVTAIDGTLENVLESQQVELGPARQGITLYLEMSDERGQKLRTTLVLLKEFYSLTAYPFSKGGEKNE